MALATQPLFAWTSAVGVISTSGLLTASNSSVTGNVTATSNSINGISTVTVTDHPPTVTTAAAATPSPVTGLTTALSVLGADVDTGPSSLTYTWSATTLPSGATAPSFSPNGTNAADDSNATFSKAGAYTLTATITDPGGQTVTSSVNVTVNQTPTSVTVSPASVSINGAATQQFTATALDQFQSALATQPTFAWSATNVGTINSSGLLTAVNSSVTGSVTAIGDGINGSSSVTVTGTSPTISIGSPSASYVAGGPVTYAVTYTDPNFKSSNLTTSSITLNKTGNRHRHAERLRFGPELHGHDQQHNGRRHPGDFDRRGHGLGHGRQPGPGRRAQRDLDGGQHRPHDLDRRPSATYAAGGPVTYTVTYADANFNTSTLVPANITLNETGTANGTVSVSGSGLTRTVTISSITGNGTLGISIAAGTASDLAGNLAPAAGPSTTFIVDNTPPTISIGSPSAAYASGRVRSPTR